MSPDLSPIKDVLDLICRTLGQLSGLMMDLHRLSLLRHEVQVTCESINKVNIDHLILRDLASVLTREGFPLRKLFRVMIDGKF